MRFASSFLFPLFLLLIPLGAKAAAGPLEVFVSIAPQQFIVDRIGGPQVKSHLLVDKGQDPHSFEPTPRRLMALGSARLYFTIGLEFERQLTDRLCKNFADLRFVAMDKGIDKLPMQEHEGEGRHGSGKAQLGEKDPHIWLSPMLLLKMAENTASALVKADPAHADAFRDRLAELRKDILAVHARLNKELLPFRGKTFYVFHPAFAYFAAAFGLKQRAVEAGGRSPSPRQLTALIEQARKDKVRIIFVQPQFDQKGAKAVARAIDGTVINLDPLAYNVLANFTLIAESLDRSFKGRLAEEKKDGR